MAGLRSMGAPLVAFSLVSMLFAIDGLSWDRPCAHLETFSGVGAVTAGELEAGRRAISFDIVHDNVRQNILTDSGFANALYWCCNLAPGGGKVTAPVCATWVWLSRGSTLRSKTCPLGRCDSEVVQEANIMFGRLMILLMICSAKKVWWILEQPHSSIMHYHPLFQRFLQLRGVEVRKLFTCMGWFGAGSKKPTHLYSSHQVIEELNDYADKNFIPKQDMEVSRKYTDGSGRPRVCGGRNLKQTQAYPKRFGRVLSKLRTKHKKSMKKEAREFLRTALSSDQGGPDHRPLINQAWIEGANLKPIIQYLSK